MKVFALLYISGGSGKFSKEHFKNNRGKGGKGFKKKHKHKSGKDGEHFDSHKKVFLDQAKIMHYNTDIVVKKDI